MTQPEVIEFCRIGEPYGQFSNFSPHSIFLDGTTWPTSEHYYQAQKCASGEDRLRVLLAKSPMVAVQLGRSRSLRIRADWDNVRDGVMRKAVRAKVLQHSDVRELLLGTGDSLIVEHTPRDSYWGDGGDGSGKNMLGRILMEVRAELTKDGPYDELGDALPPPWVRYPDVPRSSIGWRMGYGEDYLNKWEPWYSGLSAQGKRRYQAMYPPPAGEWEGYWDGSVV